MIVVPNVYVLHGSKYSQDAQAVIDNFPSTPTSGQQDAIAVFVDNLVTSGNWAKIHNMVFAKGLASINKKRHWKTATDAILGDGSNSATFPNEVAAGWENDGTRYVNLNWGYNDGVNAAIDRYGFGAKAETITGYTTGSIYGLIGIDGTSIRAYIEFYESLSNDMLFRMFGGNSVSYNEGASTTMGLLTSQVVRDSYPSGTQRIQGYINGVLEGNAVETVNTLSTNKYYLFALNNLDSPGTYYKGTASFAFHYDPVGFNHVSLNTELNTLIANI